jgi:hypothetical protein
LASTQTEISAEAERFLPVTERRFKTRRIKAKSTAVARAMASFVNDVQGCFGVQGGQGVLRQKTLSLSPY